MRFRLHNLLIEEKYSVVLTLLKKLENENRTFGLELACKIDAMRSELQKENDLKAIILSLSTLRDEKDALEADDYSSRHALGQFVQLAFNGSEKIDPSIIHEVFHHVQSSSPGIISRVSFINSNDVKVGQKIAPYGCVIPSHEVCRENLASIVLSVGLRMTRCLRTYFGTENLQNCRMHQYFPLLGILSQDGGVRLSYSDGTWEEFVKT
jgi:hypothetical protein